jgi:hypothetical protein
MRDDIDLIENDIRIEYVERRVVQRAREYDIFEELEAKRLVNLLLDEGVVDGDRLVEVRDLFKKIAVVCFVGGEVRII